MSINAQQNDPNAKLELEPAVIDVLCTNAQTNSPLILKKIKSFSKFEESLFLVSDKKPILLEAYKNSSTIDPSHKKEVAALWNEKYNQIYCPPGLGFSPDGYLDFHLLLSEQYLAFETLYAPNGEYKANINRVVDFNPTDDKDQPVTLLDLIDYYIDHPIGQMTEAKSIADNFKYYYKLITEKWGAKHYNELTEEERKAGR